MSWVDRRARLLKSFWGRGLLWLLSMAYGAGVLARGLLYDLRVLKPRRIDAKVVCIGNLTTGGTGKTPATILAALTLRRRDHHVAILSRGYGRPQKDAEVCVLHDDSEMDWKRCGDEPWMMHQILKGQDVPILVSPDRVGAAAQAVTFFDSRVVVLDDGFQHRRLARDLDVVLVNALDPFGGHALLPLGTLREPLGALRRAHLIMLTHVDLAEPEALAALRQVIHKANPRAPLLEAVHRPDFLLEVKTQAKQRFDHLQGRPVAALSGLASPQQFEDSLERSGVPISQRWRYPDHHRYTKRELTSVDHLRAGLPLVTTFKDLVKFPADWRGMLSGEVYVLSIRLDIVKGKSIWLETLGGLVGEKV
ncbi:MAG: tetraacyldisaccharide 4'-kinase [Elusimicrobia bacterium]|nr:tetraacyldisaccharide 4'-kinase [Elusimicrobiota bacterium]